MKHPSLYDARTIEGGKYFLFGVECPTEVMAAVERLYARVQVQVQGDIILTWVVTTTLISSDMAFGEYLVGVLEGLGWRRQD